MYKRTEEAIRRNPPTRGGVMVNCQMGKATYSDIAFTIPTRIDASGAYYVIEEITDDMNEEIKTEIKGVSVNQFSRKLEYKGEASISEDVATCLRATDYKCPHVVHEYAIYKGREIKEGRRYRIRKLTEREAFRLMGVDDKDIDTIQDAGISKTQQYKMAGNSIVVDVLYHIFRKMFVDTKADPGTQLELF